MSNLDLEQHNPSRPRAGDVIDVPAIGHCVVLSGDDPSLIHLKTPGGSTLKISDHALRDMLTLDPADRLRREETGHA